MDQSENLQELIIALATAQGEMQAAKFNKKNPHYGSRYADFTSCMDACREPLSKNGLAVMQFTETLNERLFLTTLLAHKSGQYIKARYPINLIKQDSQAIGSAMTYAKRYSLSAMLGIVSEEDEGLDDDGNGSSELKPQAQKAQNTPPSAPAAPIKYVTPVQVAALYEMRKLFTPQSRAAMDTWIKHDFNATKQEQIPSTSYPTVYGRYEGVIKWQQQQAIEAEKAQQAAQNPEVK